MTTLKQKLLPSPMQGGGFGGGAYLLRDEFSDVRAAGAVNGTPAVPGPGVRAAVDTANLLSIGGGFLDYAGGQGTPVTGDPGLWYSAPSFARTPGRLIKAHIRPTVSGAISDIGWDTNTSSSVVDAIRVGTGSLLTLGLIVAGVGITAPGAMVLGADQFVVVVQRAAGALYFFWGGNFVYPTLMFVSLVGSATPLFAAVTNRNQICKSGFVKVPQALYFATPWYDTFTRTNGALGSSESVGPDGQATPVTAWVNQEGTFGITGNAAQATALVTGIANATLATTYADAHIRATLTRAAGNIGINARYQNSSNYLRAYHDGTNVVCQQVVAGTPTTLRTGAAAFGAGVIYLIVRGTTGWLFYNNAAVGASFTVPDSAQTAHGVHTTDLGNTVQTIEMWPDGGNGEHSRLSSM